MECKMEQYKEDSYINSIKCKVKANVSEHRIQKRSIQFNSHRKNYDEVSTKLKLPKLEDFETLCRSFSQKKKLEDLAKIRFGLSGGGRYVTSFLKVNGVLYALVGAFTGCNTKMQLEAGYSIINLGLGSQEECLKVCNKVGVYLVAFLMGGNPQMQVICAWAFGNLCGSFEKVCSLASSQGFEGAIKSAFESSNQEVVQTACFALNQYFWTCPSKIVELADDSLIHHALTFCFKDQNVLEKSDFFWLVFLTSTKLETSQILVKHGALQASLDTLKNMSAYGVVDVPILTVLTRLLLNCLAFSRDSAQVIFNHPDGLSVIKTLLGSPFEHLKKESIQLLANIINGGTLSNEQELNVKQFFDSSLNSFIF